MVGPHRNLATLDDFPSSLDSATRNDSTARLGGWPGAFWVPRITTATLAAAGPKASTPAEMV